MERRPVADAVRRCCQSTHCGLWGIFDEISFHCLACRIVGPGFFCLGSGVATYGGYPLGQLAIPVLVVHHKQDGCKHCAYAELPRLMDALTATPKKQLLTFEGGGSRGDPCEAYAYHGFNGIEHNVVNKIAEWLMAQ